MAIKIDANQSATAFHINDGAVLFPYAVDAQSAIGRHPLEWSDKPWTPEAAAAARSRINESNKAAGLAPIAEPAPLSPEDQKAIDEHNKAVAEAAARLKAYHDKKAKEQAEADQAAQDEAIVSSVPPQPDPTRRLSPAQIRKQSATLSPAEAKIVADKAEADRLAASGAKPTF